MTRARCSSGVDLGGPAIVAVGDALEIVAHEFGELRLARADDDQVEEVLVTGARIVEEHLGAVCEQTL